MRFRGDLYKAGQLYLSGVNGDIQQQTATSGLLSWSGWFGLPSGGYPPLGDDYQLRLDDGRSAAIRILSVSTGSAQPPVARFKVNGPLQ